VNGIEVLLTNCGGAANSYVSLFTNYGNNQATTAFQNTNWPFCVDLYNSLNQMGGVIPAAYFTFMELSFGGGSCNRCYTQTDGRQSVYDITGAAIGFR